MDLLNDLTRDDGVVLSENAKKKILDNLNSSLWLFTEIEEIKKKLDPKEGSRASSGDMQLSKLEDIASRFDSRIQKLEMVNQTLGNDLIAILNSINSNIQNLPEVLYTKGFIGFDKGQEKNLENVGRVEVMEITTQQNKGNTQDNEKEKEEAQLDIDAAKTIQELDSTQESQFSGCAVFFPGLAFCLFGLSDGFLVGFLLLFFSAVFLIFLSWPLWFFSAFSM